MHFVFLCFDRCNSRAGIYINNIIPAVFGGEDVNWKLYTTVAYGEDNVIEQK